VCPHFHDHPRRSQRSKQFRKIFFRRPQLAFDRFSPSNPKMQKLLDRSPRSTPTVSRPRLGPGTAAWRPSFLFVVPGLGSSLSPFCHHFFDTLLHRTMRFSQLAGSIDVFLSITVPR
jgi:hypothetical protein